MLNFDTALFVVSECIAEARSSEENGNSPRARTLYQLAECYAIQAGFTELLRLVWAYQDSEGNAETG
jgi:hypothetical protein